MVEPLERPTVPLPLGCKIEVDQFRDDHWGLRVADSVDVLQLDGIASRVVCMEPKCAAMRSDMERPVPRTPRAQKTQRATA